MTGKYHIRLKNITRQFVETDSPEEAWESISEDVDAEASDLFQIDGIDEEGQVVDREIRQ